MNQQEKYLARVMLKNKIYQSDSQSFEDLVVNVLQHQSVTFTPVKPQGSYGDRKNDGFDPATNSYYQIYGPEDLPKKQKPLRCRPTAILSLTTSKNLKQ